MLAHPPTKPAHALPRVQVRSRAHGQLWSRPEGCKTASRKKTSFSRLRAHARCLLAQTVPKANALFLRASVSSKTVGEYGNGGATSAGRTEYIWLPTDDGSAIPIAMLRGSRYYNIHSDHLGTPRLIKDDQAKPTWQWAYSAFGDNKPTGILKATTNPNSAITNQPVLLVATNPGTVLNLRFPGQYWDSETGLAYNWNRYYQAIQGRYTQNDPKGLLAGFNRFGYVGGNPLTAFDPDGLNARQLAMFCAKDPMACATAAAAVAAAAAEAIINICKPSIPDVNPGNLCEQLALQEAKAGAGEVIMTALGDEPRLVALYGPGQWVKKQHQHRCHDGRNLVIHYFSNGIRNEELKFK